LGEHGQVTPGNGVLIGCHKEGKCIGNKGSDLNHLSSSGSNGNASAGITVEEGSSNNQITNMSSGGNGGSFDLIGECNSGLRCRTRC
jgi:hypothetical protein